MSDKAASKQRGHVMGRRDRAAPRSRGVEKIRRFMKFTFQTSPVVKSSSEQSRKSK